jgi:DNA-binding XRE family transcriptional regulator
MARQTKIADQPYLMRLADGRRLAVEVPARWVKYDRGRELGFTIVGVRFLDRLRALFSPMKSPPSPGFIRSLREALGLTQSEFGNSVGVDKLTVSRSERGELRPGKRSLRALQKIRSAAVRKGISLSA